MYDVDLRSLERMSFEQVEVYAPHSGSVLLPCTSPHVWCTHTQHLPPSLLFPVKRPAGEKASLFKSCSRPYSLSVLLNFTLAVPYPLCQERKREKNEDDDNTSPPLSAHVEVERDRRSVQTGERNREKKEGCLEEFLR